MTSTILELISGPPALIGVMILSGLIITLNLKIIYEKLKALNDKNNHTRTLIYTVRDEIKDRYQEKKDHEAAILSLKDFMDARLKHLEDLITTHNHNHKELIKLILQKEK